MAKASWDTSKNYELLVHLIYRAGLTGVDVLDMLTNYHGLQLLSEEATRSMLGEYLDEDDEDEDDE